MRKQMHRQPLRYWSEALQTKVTIPDDLVSERDACPKCGERNQDSLVWDDSENVTCAICGTVYTP